jgi:hypothetical protein
MARHDEKGYYYMGIGTIIDTRFPFTVPVEEEGKDEVGVEILKKDEHPPTSRDEWERRNRSGTDDVHCEWFNNHTRYCCKWKGDRVWTCTSSDSNSTPTNPDRE